MTMTGACEFLPESHQYRLNGDPVPSSTQVLREAGYVRFDGVPTTILEAAQARGKRVHDALHFIHEGDLDPSSVDDEDLPYLECAKRFEQEYGLHVDRAEFRVWSQRHRYAGTLDVLGRDEQSGVLLDYKTGHPDDVACDLQTASYWACLIEMGSEDQALQRLFDLCSPVRRLGVRLRAGKSAVVTTYNDPRDFRRFLNALHVSNDLRVGPPRVWDWAEAR